MARVFFATVIATLAITALMYMNVRLNLFPQFDILDDIRGFNRRIGLPATDQAVWVTHLIIGIGLCGLLFALLEPILPGHGFSSGLWFGVLTWLVKMLVFMPISGHHIFALDLSPAFIAITLGMNLLYGGILGMAYEAFGDE